MPRKRTLRKKRPKKTGNVQFKRCTFLIWKIAIWRKNVTQMIKPFANGINSVQKEVELTILAKNRRKMRIINRNFRSKIWYLWLVELFEIGLPNHLHKVRFFVKCKCSNSYSAVWSWALKPTLLFITHYCFKCFLKFFSFSFKTFWWW